MIPFIAMTLLSYPRCLILRAIHATCIAFFLAVAACHVQGQTFTAPFVIDNATTSVSTSPAGTYTGAVGFYDIGHTYNSISINPGVSIQNTVQFGSEVNGVYGLITTATGTLTNAGTLSISTAADPSQADVNLNQGATPLTVTNNGTMTVAAGTNIGYALFVGGTTGAMNVVNSGKMTVSGAADSNVVDLNSASGVISFRNTASGSVTLNNPGLGYAVKLETGNANITFENDGSIVSTSNGVKIGENNGTITATNNGTIQIAAAGSSAILAGANGPINVTNNGTLTSSDGLGYGVNAQGGNSPITVTNNNTVSNVQYGLAVFSTGGPQSVTNTGTITSSISGIYGSTTSPASQSIITNSGVINSSGTGILNLDAVTVRDSGNITSTTDSISVASGSSVTLMRAPVINNIISGGANSGSTSTLAFNLTVSAAEYASVHALLNTDIAIYNLNGGGFLDFDLGTNLDYQILNFAANGITNGVTARYYSNVPGFGGLGTALDNFGLNPTATTILTALGNVSDPGLPGALAELSPKSLEVFRNIAFDNNTFYVAQINDHLANLRDGMSGFDSSALSVNSGDVDPGLAPINDHLKTYNAGDRPGLTNGLVDPKDMKEMRDTKSMQTAATEPADRWSTFISGNVILANLDNTLPYQKSDYTTGAVTAGADYRLDDHFTVGALFSYAHTDADLDYHGSQATVDSYAPGIYASYVDGGWYANGLATYVRNSYTEDREIDIPGIGGDNHGATSGNQGTGNLTGGYEFQQGAFKFGPVATIEYVHLGIDSMQEQGPTALDIHDQNDDSLRTLIGFEGRYATAVPVGSDRWILTPHFSASWQHECLDNSNGITAQFDPAGGGSFNTPLDAPERDSAFIDAGLDAQVSKAATVFVDYQVQAGQDDFFAQSVQGGVCIKF